MPRVTLSYRRDDSAGIARLIFERLKPRYGADSVFMDIDAIEFGEDYRDKIHQALEQTDYLLVLIGSRWLGPMATGRNRINDTTDPVRMEVERALEIGLRVVPILLEGTPMPGPDELPGTLGRLPYLNAAEVTAGREFDGQMDRIIRFIDRTFAEKEARRAREAAPPAPDPVPPVPDPVPVPPAPVPAPAPPAPVPPPPVPPPPVPPAPVPPFPVPPGPVPGPRPHPAAIALGVLGLLGLGAFVVLVNAISHVGSVVARATEAPTAAPTIRIFSFPTAVPTETAATARPASVPTFNVFSAPYVPLRANLSVPSGYSVMYRKLPGLFWRATQCRRVGSSAQVGIRIFNDYRGTANTDVALTKVVKSLSAGDWIPGRKHLATGLSPTLLRTLPHFTCGQRVSSGLRSIRFGLDLGPYVQYY